MMSKANRRPGWKTGQEDLRGTERIEKARESKEDQRDYSPAF